MSVHAVSSVVWHWTLSVSSRVQVGYRGLGVGLNDRDDVSRLMIETAIGGVTANATSRTTIHGR